MRSLELNRFFLAGLCSGQSNMAFAAGVPLNDPAAEAKIAAAYATDPGASIDGKYMDATAGIAAATKFPDMRLMTVGNVHDCKEPIIDFYPSGTNDSTHPLYHPWAVASPDTVASSKSYEPGQMSASVSDLSPVKRLPRPRIVAPPFVCRPYESTYCRAWVGVTGSPLLSRRGGHSNVTQRNVT